MLYMVIPNTPTGSDTLKSYNLVECKEAITLEINPAKFSAATSKTFFYRNISLLNGKLNNETWKLIFYQLENSKSWEPVSHSRFSISALQFNLENSISVSHKSDGVILVSVLHDQVKNAYHVVFHIFSQKSVSGNWKSAWSQPLLSARSSVKCEIQSCVVTSTDVYFSLLLSDAGAFIYKFELRSLQQYRKSPKDDGISPNCTWNIKIATLQNCFLSMFKEEVFTITFNNVSTKSIMEVKKPLIKNNSAYFSPVKCQYNFPYVKIVTASFVTGFEDLAVIAVMYHDKKSNKYCVKRVSLT